jgi:hypothetical protein
VAEYLRVFHHVGFFFDFAGAPPLYLPPTLWGDTEGWGKVKLRGGTDPKWTKPIRRQPQAEGLRKRRQVSPHPTGHIG